MRVDIKDSDPVVRPWLAPFTHEEQHLIIVQLITALLIAVRKVRVECVRILCEAGAKLNGQGRELVACLHATFS